MLGKEKTQNVLAIIYEMFPNAKCELNYDTPFQLLIAVILSAQTTDVGVNKATPQLFARFPDAYHLAKAPIDEIIECIQSIGLYRNKAKNIKSCARLLSEKYNGEVPQTREELIALPGVGRKTANVVLGEAFHVPALAVDTHVERVSKRLAIVKSEATVSEVEETLMKKISKNMWVKTHHTLIFFGRYHCTAKNPKCDKCPVLQYCKEGKKKLGII